MNNSTKDIILRQYEDRIKNPRRKHIKINLFNALEINAIEEIVSDRSMSQSIAFDCVMVGDSFLTTHLGLRDTQLNGRENAEFFRRVYFNLLLGVRHALDCSRKLHSDMYLLADMPYGTTGTPEQALSNANQMIRYGADAIKMEIGNSKMLDIAHALCDAGIPFVGHVGYSPQAGGKKSRAYDPEDAAIIAHTLSKLSNMGASAVVLEGVSTTFLKDASNPTPGSLPIYAIFSGDAAHAGQSLNIWDSVYINPDKKRFFPTSASLDISTYPESYTKSCIQSHFWKLCHDVINGNFPKTRNPQGAALRQLQQYMKTVNVWELDSELALDN